MRRIDTVVIHCSASKDGKPKTREEIEREHKARGFRTIGYHYIIEPNGTVIFGRPENQVGAHVEGHNANTIGVCLIGTKRFTKAAWASLKLLCEGFKMRKPEITFRGHRDYSPDTDHDGVVEPSEWVKLCPNFDVKAWVEAGMVPPAGNLL